MELYIYILAIIAKNTLFNKLNLGYDDYYHILKDSTIYQVLWKNPIDYPLWYLRDLIVMCTISPVIFYFVKYLKLAGIILIALLYILNIEIPLPGFSNTAIFFFSLGAFLINNIEYTIRKLKAIGIYIVLISLILLIVATYYNGSPKEYEFYIRLFIIPGTFSLIYWGTIIQKITKISDLLLNLSKTVFFIYAIHVIYLINWSKGIIMKFVFFRTDYGLIAAYILAPLLCIFLCLIIYYILIKISPKLLNLLCGKVVTIRVETGTDKNK